MRIRGLVQNKVMLILIDSGSSHNFVSQSFLDQIGMVTWAAVLLQVRVANGSLINRCMLWSGGHKATLSI
jgi:hypothetical protein